jgi:hypothetical protein
MDEGGIMGKWIDINEKKPKICKHVLLTNGYYIEVGYMDCIDGEKAFYRDGVTRSLPLPTHWRKLPKIAKEKLFKIKLSNEEIAYLDGLITTGLERAISKKELNLLDSINIKIAEVLRAPIKKEDNK